MMVSETGSVQNIGPFNVSDHARFADSREALGRIGLFLVGTLFAATVAAEAHDAPAGWSYSSECCSGVDCYEVPDGRVTAASDGWRINLQPGDHPFVPRGLQATVPYGDARNRVSGDTHFHVCLSMSTSHLLCLYSPPMGM